MGAFDVAIAGGGIIGLSTAFELANAGFRVIVFDCREPGRESSWAAAGMLAPVPESPGSGTLVALEKASYSLYSQFIARVQESSGKSTSFAREGALETFSGDSADADRNKFVVEHHRHGLLAEAISPEAARKMESALGSSARAVAWLRDEATVDPRLLLEAITSAIVNRGVQLRANCAVSSLLIEDGRCAGVISGGQRVPARYVVIAAGCFSRDLCDRAARYAPTRPVRGQMIAFRHRDVRITRVLRSQAGYLVPRADGRIIAGSTLEDVGFTKAVTPEGLQEILSAAIQLAPELANAEILDTWCGLRPGTTDDLPLIGPTDIEGLLVATGHYRNGILLAPITAKLIREWITSVTPSLDVADFSPLRFSNSKTHSVSAIAE